MGVRVAEPRTRRGRVVRPTWKVRDELPEAPGSVETAQSSSNIPTVAPAGPLRRVRLLVTQVTRTVANKFGLARIYKRRPVNTRSDTVDLQQAYTPAVNSLRDPRPIPDIIHPFPNLSCYLYSRHHWLDGDKKTLENRRALSGLLGSSLFVQDDIKGQNFEVLEDRLYEQIGQKSTAESRRTDAAARQRASRHDHVPTTAAEHPVEGEPYPVHGFWHKNLCDEIKKTASSDPAASRFVWDPHQVEYTSQPGAPPESVYGELYNSQVFIQEDLRLQNSPSEDGCDLPRAIAACMFASDATLVTQWGQKKVWPVYMYFGNQSKYERARPTAHAGHLVGYLPSLPDDVQDFIRAKFGKPGTATYLTHCRRELFQGAWAIMLDDQFVEAYKHGMVVDCADGIRRRIYPRIFIYSADYPEKVLIATLRDKGGCPCVRCTIPFDLIPNLGTAEDMAIRVNQARADTAERRSQVEEARKLIYEDGYVVTIPTVNAFASRIGQHEHSRFDFHRILAVDELHEWEIGTWKAVLLHLIRILEASGGDLIHIFNERFRNVPVFGQCTIRKFSTSVSDMKRMAARDYEDILQCIIPCIEGLLPSPFNEDILDLLYVCNYWHSLAKMRMHTDSSLALFDHVTTALGNHLRYFERVTCPHFATKETQREYQTRIRAESRRNVQQPGVGPLASSGASGRRERKFQMKTIKAHSLGDYPNYIRENGTTDSYSTKIGEQRHREPKRQKTRVSDKNADAQMIKVETIQNRLRDIQYELARDYGFRVRNHIPMFVTAKEPGDVENSDIVKPEDHHKMAKSEKDPLYVRYWLADHASDPATEHFSASLNAHICERLDIPTASQIIFEKERIYQHAIFHVNHTTYDLQRDRDTIHRSTDRVAIMVASRDSESSRCPWMYAEVLGIYHANVLQPDNPDASTATRLEFLWVRWMERDTSEAAGVSSYRLQRLKYAPIDSVDAFGFVDPVSVIRGCHLIPAFYHGRGPSPAQESLVHNTGRDWKYYYVMRFVDRDMNTRYMGLGVGHIDGVKARYPESMTSEIWNKVIPESADKDTASQDSNNNLPEGAHAEARMVDLENVDENVTSDDEHSNDEDELQLSDLDNELENNLDL
ncbi:hypothetical protein EUX98_g9355 [Antrodiella citrinella]|uniref:Uncharacterized protein n=1 Tax=Antrodiella citrinella TaxID=2447956 RepID=A0A4S4LUG1_9APHY|nr:hypothetical protein EUX98_g9355 [Antrodiella citrinella]